MVKPELINTLKHRLTKLLQCLLIVAGTLLPWSATAVNQGKLSSVAGRDIVESLLVKSLMEIAEGNTKQAMHTVNELIRTTPNFKLAHLIRGDLLSTKAGILYDNKIPPALAASSAEEIKGLREEARTRVNHYFSANSGQQVPDLSFKMNAQQKHLILIDTVKSRLFLYKKSPTGLTQVADYYISIGKNGADKNVEGDKRTPTGLYFAGSKLTQPLSDFYGDGAYPLNYPNELDVHNKKTGYGIWLHGTPKDTYSRPPRASDGCVVLSNPDIKKLHPILQAGNVPVIISDSVNWISHDEALKKQADVKSLQKAVEQWRTDWMSRDANQYLSNYSKGFFYSDGQLPQWVAHKRRVLAGKPKITVKVSNLSMFSYPTHAHEANGESEQIVVVNFEQYYKSPTLSDTMQKRQYWKKENNQWKIIYEGAA